MCCIWRNNNNKWRWRLWTEDIACCKCLLRWGLDNALLLTFSTVLTFLNVFNFFEENAFLTFFYNNNNIHICIAPYGRNFRGAVYCVSERSEQLQCSGGKRTYVKAALNAIKCLILRWRTEAVYSTQTLLTCQKNYCSLRCDRCALSIQTAPSIIFIH